MTPWPVTRLVARGMLTLLLLLGGFGTWAVLARLDGAIMVQGQVTLRDHRQIVQHANGGTVATIRIAEGDTVSAGDLLIQLDPTDTQLELAILESQLFALLARRARLEAERDDTLSLRFDTLLLAANSPDNAALMAGQEALFLSRIDSTRRQADQLHQRRAQTTSQR